MSDWTDIVTPDMLTRRVTLEQYLCEQLAPSFRRVAYLLPST